MVDTVVIHILREFQPQVYEYCFNNSKQMKHGWIVLNRLGVAVQEPRLVFKTIEYDDAAVQLITGEYKVKSSAYHVNFRMFEDRVKLEFSIPKFIYGHNVAMLCRHSSPAFPFSYELFNRALRYCLKKMFPLFRHYHGILIKRIDFCFNQIYANQKNTELAIMHFHESILNANHKRTGLYQITKSSYMKVYHKGAEFREHDFKRLYGTYFNENDMEHILEIADRTLRFEDQKTPKNWSYPFLRWRFAKSHRYYLELKSKAPRSKEFKQYHRAFEKRITFSLTDMGDTIENVYYLDPKFFNMMLNNFLDTTKKTFSIPEKTISALQAELDDTSKHPTTKAANSRILAFIKAYGSLEKAVQAKAINERTARRYRNRMRDYGIQSTDRQLVIKQDWTMKTYHLLRPYIKRLTTKEESFYF